MSKTDHILQVIRDREWYPFGAKRFGCPGLTEQILQQYKASARLPPPCDACYKALIFWKVPPQPADLVRLDEMVAQLPGEIRGKFNEDVVVFYFRTLPEMHALLAGLPRHMESAGVSGRTQWRRACKEYQDQCPRWWKDAKTFSPSLEK